MDRANYDLWIETSPIPPQPIVEMILKAVQA